MQFIHFGLDLKLKYDVRLVSVASKQKVGLLLVAVRHEARSLQFTIKYDSICYQLEPRMRLSSI